MASLVFPSGAAMATGTARHWAARERWISSRSTVTSGGAWIASRTRSPFTAVTTTRTTLPMTMVSPTLRVNTNMCISLPGLLELQNFGKHMRRGLAAGQRQADTSRIESYRLQDHEAGIKNGLRPGNFSLVRGNMIAENGVFRQQF